MAMRLIAITPAYFYPGEADAIAAALTERGFWRVHLRKPGASREEMRRLIEEIPAALRQRLSLHDFHDLARDAGIGGVHLGSRNPSAPAGWMGFTSRSIHSADEIGGVTEDYAFLSPVFPSLSKPGYASAVTAAGISALSPMLNDRIFALGGVTPADLPALEGAGFGGAAMLAAAWSPRISPDSFRLQFITHPTPRYSVTEGARLALEGGCRWIQLRHKDADEATLLTEASEIAALCRRYAATFIIDDHVELVNRTGADGVHLGRNDMPVDRARMILGPGKIIGATANTFSHIMEAAQGGADYIGLGPFRFTETKKNLSPVLCTGGYADIMASCASMHLRLPVVAIGGITAADIPAIMATGVSGIALSSTVLAAPHPERETALILEQIKLSSNG